VARGQRALDAGCGPGALTAELVRRLGPAAVCAAEPSASFAAATRERLPGTGVSQSAAERLPFRDQVFDAALAQLVVHFMADPVAGLREMGRRDESSLAGASRGSGRALSYDIQGGEHDGHADS
jgi:ubiquinone/menaquinone biosynthesis C-methylase UbiE